MSLFFLPKHTFKVVALYVLAFICSLVASNRAGAVFWSIYIVLVTAANVLTFDAIVDVMDFQDLKQIDGLAKSVYILSVCMLSGLFAVASVLFLR